jgi:hypothetical protein
VGRFKPNLQPKPKMPFKGSKRPKFLKTNFFNEHNFFNGPNPYDSARAGRTRFWTPTQMNYYASVLFDKEKVFEH